MLHSMQEILDRAKAMPGRRVAVAAAHDKAVLEAVKAAKELGVAEAVLVGHAEEIEAILSELGADSAEFDIVPADTDHPAGSRPIASFAVTKE